MSFAKLNELKHHTQRIHKSPDLTASGYGKFKLKGLNQPSSSSSSSTTTTTTTNNNTRDTFHGKCTS
jgi:hypothetical protein